MQQGDWFYTDSCCSDWWMMSDEDSPSLRQQSVVGVQWGITTAYLSWIAGVLFVMIGESTSISGLAGWFLAVIFPLSAFFFGIIWSGKHPESMNLRRRVKIIGILALYPIVGILFMVAYYNFGAVIDSVLPFEDSTAFVLFVVNPAIGLAIAYGHRTIQSLR
jgi:hypothetical protein